MLSFSSPLLQFYYISTKDAISWAIFGLCLHVWIKFIRSCLDLKIFNDFLYQTTFLWLLADFFLVLLKAQNVDGWPLRLLLWSASKEMVLWEMTHFLFEADEINCPLNVSPLLTAERQVLAGYLADTASQCWMRWIPSHRWVSKALCSQKVPRHHQVNLLHSLVTGPDTLSPATRDRRVPGV